MIRRTPIPLMAALFLAALPAASPAAAEPMKGRYELRCQDPQTRQWTVAGQVTDPEIAEQPASQPSSGGKAGGRVVRGGLMHGKTSPISHDGTGVFEGIPSPFTATRYHSLIVDDIPAELIVNATADDGSVMGFRHATLPIHGVQFHPESIATEHGHKLLDNFLKLTGQKTSRLPNRALV